MIPKDSELPSFKPSWKIEGETVVIVIPKGHDVYPEGREIRFKIYTPTDLETREGSVTFPNNDELTAATLNSRTPSNAEINTLIAQFEEANRVIDDLKQLQEKIITLIKQMIPNDLEGGIRLEAAALGKKNNEGNIEIPLANEIRDKGFFFQGIEYHDRLGNSKVYVMALNAEGKFNYNSEDGLLYVVNS